MDCRYLFIVLFYLLNCFKVYFRISFIKLLLLFGIDIIVYIIVNIDVELLYIVLGFFLEIMYCGYYFY